MFGDLRVVIVTPAGRARYLEILLPQVKVLRDAGLADEYRLWVNTTDARDIQWMERAAAEDPEFVKLERLTVPHDGSFSIYSFFKNCTDPRAIYVRFDDDLVLLDDPERFAEYLAFRVAHPEYFLVYGNILNNAAIAYIHQRVGNLNAAAGVTGPDCMDEIGWRAPWFARNLHEQVLAARDLARFRLPFNWTLVNYERVSINCISWLGARFAEFGGKIAKDEEANLSQERPKLMKLPNCIYGGFACVHFAFYVQRERLERTDILARYRDWAAERVKSQKEALAAAAALAAPELTRAPSATAECPQTCS